MYLYQNQGGDYKIVDKQWEHIRDQLVNMQSMASSRTVTVNDGDNLKNGDLYLKHWYEGVILMGNTSKGIAVYPSALGPAGFSGDSDLRQEHAFSVCWERGPPEIFIDLKGSETNLSGFAAFWFS